MNNFKGCKFPTINNDDTISIVVVEQISSTEKYDHVLSIADKDFSYEEALKIKEYLNQNLPDKYFQERY